jgi:hypothetical protein
VRNTQPFILHELFQMVPQRDEFVSSSLRTDCFGPRGKCSRLDCDERLKESRLSCHRGVAFCK